jgi:HPt (histidine-containing phosphotransfer) domain-containing protein
MRSFTRPLVAAIYGEGNDTDKSFGDILKLFLDPSVQSARQKLVDLAIALNIGIEEIPAFLERYADIYMSLAYYRGCLEALSPGLTDILETIKSLSSSSPYRDDPTLMQACKLIQDRLENAKSGIANIIVLFETRTQDMWNDVSHQSFREIDDLITSYQREMGGAICALTVKEMAWSRLTGKNSLSNCAACIMSDIVRGIDLVPVIEFADEPGA